MLRFICQYVLNDEKIKIVKSFRLPKNRFRFTYFLMVFLFLVAVAGSLTVNLHKVTFALTVDSLSKNSGSVDGGEELTLKGSGFIKNERVKEIVRGNAHYFAITDSGKAFAWGNNYKGQLGTGDSVYARKPLAFEITDKFGGEKVAKIFNLGNNFSFAITDSGKVFAWGDNDKGQLGTGDTEDKLVPTEITDKFGGEKVVRLNYLGDFASVITDSGKVFAWGNDSAFGKTIKNDGKTPTDVSDKFDNEKVIQISGDDRSVFAVTNSGKVFAWGDNHMGQLGTGDTEDKSVPTEILTGVKTAQLFTNSDSYFTYAITDSGKVFVWGSNYKGQLGTGDTENKLVPIEITDKFGGERITKISIGRTNSIAFAESGKIFFCGESVLFDNSIGNTGKLIPFEIDRGRFSGLGAPLPQVSNIYFGDTEVTDFKIVDANTIKLKTPPKTAGATAIFIRGIDGKKIKLPITYTYVGQDQSESGQFTNYSGTTLKTPDTGLKGENDKDLLVGFSCGGALMALIARVCVGIYKRR